MGNGIEHRRPTGKSLPRANRPNPDLLDMLLSPLIHTRFFRAPDGTLQCVRVKLRGTRDQIRRYASLIFE
jgi:hypothetical protein